MPDHGKPEDFIQEHYAPVATTDEEIQPVPPEPLERITIKPKSSAFPSRASTSSSTSASNEHGAVELVEGPSPTSQPPLQTNTAALETPNTSNPDSDLNSKPPRFAFLRRPQFYIVLALSQALAITQTGTNTLTTLLADAGTSIPAFQSLFNYVLLALIYTSITIYRYGWRKWLKLIWKDGWKYFILAFFDVEGNYFTVLAYRYTTILSAQLINFWV